MRITALFGILLVYLCIISCFSAQALAKALAKATYSDARYGFSIDAPHFPDIKPGQQVPVVQIHAPPVDSFSANINVMLQRVSITRAKYLKQTKQQFVEMGIKLLSTKNVTVSGKPALLLEYEGKMSGRELRFAAMAVIRKTDVLLATCASLSQHFKTYGPLCQKSLASLRVK